MLKVTPDGLPRPRATWAPILAAMALAATALSCSHAVGGPMAQSMGTPDADVDDAGNVQTVLVGPNAEHSYLPMDLTVPVGTTVEWLWESDGHNVVSGPGGVADGLFCSPGDTDCASTPVTNAGTIYRHKFTAPGSYPYFCAPHYPVGMKGTITVQ